MFYYVQATDKLSQEVFTIFRIPNLQEAWRVANRYHQVDDMFDYSVVSEDTVPNAPLSMMTLERDRVIWEGMMQGRGMPQ